MKIIAYIKLSNVRPDYLLYTDAVYGGDSWHSFNVNLPLDAEMSLTDDDSTTELATEEEAEDFMNNHVFGPYK